MLNLEWFRTFKAIYETGTLSAAAHVLTISQPGVGLHLNSLESYTGYRLFDRDTRRMVPTDRGIMLYTFLNDPINRLEQAEEVFHRDSTVDQPTISIGMCYESFVHALQDEISGLPFNVIVHFGNCQQLLHELDSGALDLIVTREKGRQPLLEFEAFAKENILLVCGSETDISGFDLLSENADQSAFRNWLAGQVWYTTSADMEEVKKFWTSNFNTSPDFKPKFILPNYSTILQCLRTANGVAMIPDFLCRQALAEGTVRLLWDKSAPYENTIYFGKKLNALHMDEIDYVERLIKNKWLPAS